MSYWRKKILFACLCLLICSCGGKRNISKEIEANKQHASVMLNRGLQQQLAQVTQYSAEAELEYRLGPGDIFKLTVFQVEDLNTVVRINGRGTIILPLLGTIHAAGKTVAELETELTRKLAADYLQDPQLSIFVEEYRSQQITVTGAVKEPNIYSIRQPHTILELLSMAGGFSEQAGSSVYVQIRQPDPETGNKIATDIILDIRQIVNDPDNPGMKVRLQGGDSIYVPDAGVVYVEGAVADPGSYKMEGEVNVLKAVAMAGGVLWETKENNIQVLRQSSGETVAIDVNLSKVRDRKTKDVVLKDGDVVVVDYNRVKRSVSGFLRGVGRIFSFNTGI